MYLGSCEIFRWMVLDVSNMKAKFISRVLGLSILIFFLGCSAQITGTMASSNNLSPKNSRIQVIAANTEPFTINNITTPHGSANMLNYTCEFVINYTLSLALNSSVIVVSIYSVEMAGYLVGAYDYGQYFLFRNYNALSGSHSQTFNLTKSVPSQNITQTFYLSYARESGLFDGMHLSWHMLVCGMIYFPALMENFISLSDAGMFETVSNASQIVFPPKDPISNSSDNNTNGNPTGQPNSLGLPLLAPIAIATSSGIIAVIYLETRKKSKC